MRIENRDLEDQDLPQGALQTLIANKQRLLAFLQHRIGSADLAAELLQDAFVKGVERGHTLREEESALAWCYRLLRNAVIDRHRRMSVERDALARLAQELSTLPDADRDLEREVCACMSDLVVTLKPEYADILRRVDLGDTRIDRVAAELGITANNAAVRLHRARQALRQRLEQMCGVCAKHGCLNCTCKDGCSG
ncbi:sigma-70 family RNA polymerase sigma factor [Haliangium sp. UPWRP_2]|uniref:RNA polymerase sigma factor n=1 Tax=Haliangium sp. UPWRP_2 TaxID=1931276 RepID=UPI000B53A4B7|nr:sigma-70 family RNA polymerase sigma factor [Haliangium sp. UPWRP_2]PSM31976.1 sigma-70 family RNA polymerase sigma factor [Haliangium sp. UPWRP_2]